MSTLDDLKINFIFILPKDKQWAVVVVKLEERSLPTPEIRGSNPVIGKFYLQSAVLKTVLKR